MLSQSFSFILGVLVFPLIHYLILRCIEVFNERKRFVAIQWNQNFNISDQLKCEIRRSLVVTNNLSWFNVLIQRVYFDIIKNYYFEYKIRENFLKSINSSIASTLVKNIKIIELDFGNEAPYLRFLKLITKEEYKALTKKRIKPLKTIYNKVFHLNDKNGSKAERYLSNDLYSNKIIDFESVSNIKASVMNKSRTFHSSKPYIEKAADETNIDEYNENFEYCTFYGEMSYVGVIQIKIEAELPSNIKINAIVQIDSIESEFIMRIPAENNSMRYELTLINSPNIGINVDSSVFRNESKKYFKKSLSSFFESTTSSLIKSMVIYPNWYQFVQPYTGTAKYVNFYPKACNSDNLEICDDNCSKILNLIGHNFKVIKIVGKILIKRSNLILNGNESICGYEVPHIKIIEHDDLSLLKYLIKGLSTTKLIKEKDQVKYLKLDIGGNWIEYVLIRYKFWVVLYRNDPNKCEFLVLRREKKITNIYNYTDSGSVLLTEQIILKFQDLVSKSKLIDSPTSTEIPKEDELTDKILIEKKFQEYLLMEKEHFSVYEIILQMKTDSLLNYLKDNSFRTRLIDENLELFDSINISNEIKKIFTKNFRNTESIIYSYFDGCIVDMFDKNQSVLIYQIVNQSSELAQEDENHNEVDDHKKDRKKCFENSLFLSSNKMPNPANPRSNSMDNLNKACLDLYMQSSIMNQNEEINHKNSMKQEKKNKNCSESKSPSITTDIELKKPGNDQISNEKREELMKGNNIYIDLRITRKTVKSPTNEEIELANGSDFKASRVDNPNEFAKLKILFKAVKEMKFPNYFIESLKLREFYDRFFENSKNSEYLASKNKLVKEIKVYQGVIEIELISNEDGFFTLELYSCKIQKKILNIEGIKSNRLFRIIYPVNNDFIKIEITAKKKENFEFKYKILNFIGENCVLIDGTVVIKKDKSFKIDFIGNPSHCIFWENQNPICLNSYLKLGKEKIPLTNSGILRSDNQKYRLVHRSNSTEQELFKIFSGLGNISKNCNKHRF